MIGLQILFWFTFVLIGFTYFGYPLLLRVLLAVSRPRPVARRDITPAVSLVIAAYNEEKSIAAKLENVLRLRYPRALLQVVVVSDCSSDRTDAFVGEFADRDVRLIRNPRRHGKIAAYRSALPHLTGEIIVFSDATSLLDPDALRHLMANFADPSVGCAGGLLRYVKPDEALVGKGEHTYWDYERRIREDESRLISLTSVSGTLYAVRRELYPAGLKDHLADDFIVPIEVHKHGLRTVLEPEAQCEELTVFTIQEEMSKRARITLQNIRGLLDQIGILNPLRHGVYSVLIICHKLLRLLVPVFLLALLLENVALALQSRLYAAVLAAHLLFYLTALVAWRIGPALRARLLESVFYFCLSNLAITVGIIRFFRGRKVVTWEPSR